MSINIYFVERILLHFDIKLLDICLKFNPIWAEKRVFKATLYEGWSSLKSIDHLFFKSFAKKFISIDSLHIDIFYYIIINTRNRFDDLEVHNMKYCNCQIQMIVFWTFKKKKINKKAFCPKISFALQPLGGYPGRWFLYGPSYFHPTT